MIKVSLKLINMHSFDFNIIDDEGMTILMYSCLNQMNAVAIKLIKSGLCNIE